MPCVYKTLRVTQKLILFESKINFVGRNYSVEYDQFLENEVYSIRAIGSFYFT